MIGSNDTRMEKSLIRYQMHHWFQDMLASKITIHMRYDILVSCTEKHNNYVLHVCYLDKWYVFVLLGNLSNTRGSMRSYLDVVYQVRSAKRI